MSNFYRRILLGAACLAVATNAAANAAMPLIIFLFPWSALLFIPVVAVEARVLFIRLHVTPRTAVFATLWSNLVSSIAGVPLVWYLLAQLQVANERGPAVIPDRVLAVTWRAPWLYPYYGEGYWMFPAAVAYFLVPLFVASVAIETLVVAAFFRASPRRYVRTVAVANVWSYLFLALLVGVWLIVNVCVHHAKAA